MFLQKTKSRRANKLYVSYLVRESFRTEKGPRSRTVCNITGLPEQVRELIGQALRGKTFVDSEELSLAGAADYGGLAVLRDAWQRYGLEEVFGGMGKQGALLKAMVFGRLLFPCSKLALKEQAEGTVLAESCGLKRCERFKDSELYWAMDALNGRWAEVEKALYKRAFKGEAKLVLYDLTSVYFEGKGPEHIARYGYSRDHRPERPQVLLAVASDGEGIPIHVEVLRGNRADSKTLQGLLKTLQRRFGIRTATFVFDGGIRSRLNLDSMTEQGLKFVTRLSRGTLEQLLRDKGNEVQMELGDVASVVELEQEGKRYVIAGGEWRRERERATREARIAKGEAALKRLAGVKRSRVDAQKLAGQAGRALAAVKAHKYFRYRVNESGELDWELKRDVIEAESGLEGLYLLETNVGAEQLSGEKVLESYKGLLEVEEAFRELKSYLEVRPVFHYRPDRVRNHVRICFIAYWLSARLGREWGMSGERGEVVRILRRLQKIRIGFIRAGGVTVKAAMTEIPKEQNEVLRRLGLLKLFSSPPEWVSEDL